jgi:hypothetical protein
MRKRVFQLLLGVLPLLGAICACGPGGASALAQGDAAQILLRAGVPSPKGFPALNDLKHMKVDSPRPADFLDDLSTGDPGTSSSSWATVLTLEPLTMRFGKDDVGKLPAAWKADHAGTGKGSVWKVVEDDTAPSRAGYVLAQTAASPKEFINLCVANDTHYQDVGVSVAFKAVRGTNNLGGGVVWRYQDHHNYYLARMNLREDNFRLYKVVSGRRIELGTQDDLIRSTDEWHTLRIEMRGDHIECYLNGKKHLEAKDSTFKRAGKVGLWTKGSSQPHFDEVQIRAR